MERIVRIPIAGSVNELESMGLESPDYWTEDFSMGGLDSGH